MIATLSKAVALLDSPARRRWLVLIVLALGAAVLETSGTAIVFALINLIGDSSNISRVPLIGSQLALLLDRFGERTIIVLCFAAAGYFAVKNAFLLYEIHYRERCAAETATATGGRLLQAYLRAPYSFYFRRNSAELMRNLESSVDSTFRTVLLSAAAGLSEIFVMFGVLGVLVAAE
ncbi:MAG: hypothetical protein FJX42_13210, partial [Alphaproteobacteria bacterium]|nr:hypothetical protein [Alphaproteobacteria bacterium]